MRSETGMARIRLRTKILFSLFLVGTGLTAATVIVARRTVEEQVRLQIFQDLRNSVSTFQNVQRQREQFLTNSAQLLADLPILKALMTTQHGPTIQDGSKDLWAQAGCDLLVLTDRKGALMALHARAADFGRDAAQAALQTSEPLESRRLWWFGNGHLYEVSIQPIEFGPRAQSRTLGHLIVGYEVDDTVVRELSQVAASHAAFRFGGKIVRSTLSPIEESELGQRANAALGSGEEPAREIQLGHERFLMSSMDLSSGIQPGAQLMVLKSLDQATAFLGKLNRLLLALALVALTVGCFMVFVFSRAFTRPLENLVEGVRALGKGDYDYPVEVRTHDEVGEVSESFLRMRSSLQESQRQLIDAERLATIGRMASSISHDLRHSLAAIMANAEFLSENHRSSSERIELYEEVRTAVGQMTDLIDSLLEFSRTRESMHPTWGSLEDPVARAVHMVAAAPEFHAIAIRLHASGSTDAWVDARKIERVVQNLVRNACEAVDPETGSVDITVEGHPKELTVRIADNGRGIPDVVRDRLFEPFVSQGKENGTGLGLTIVQKIVQDHGGDVQVETTSSSGTVFLIRLPRTHEAPVASSSGSVTLRSVARINEQR